MITLPSLLHDHGRSLRTAMLCLVGTAALRASEPPTAPAAGRPNVLIILADDLGYGDVHCYNPDRGRIPTPNIDRLAGQGMLFTDAHSSSAVCSPSRYALLTGRYHWRTRLQQWVVPPWGDPLIAPERMTIATLARQHGYRTACIGKWHLGMGWPISKEDLRHFSINRNASGQGTDVADGEQVAAWNKAFSLRIAHGPTHRGFDEYFGVDVPNWPPYCFIDGDRTVGIPSALLPRPSLAKHMASLQGPALPDWWLEGLLPALVDRSSRFIAEQSDRNRPFLLYLALTSPHTPLAVNAEWKGRSGLGTYADFVMETDAAVGTILQRLDSSGAAANTLVLFTSDNGCSAHVGKQEMERKGHFPSGPLRGSKGDAWEGGHRIPFIIRWPSTVRQGTTCDQLVHQADAMATLADILDAALAGNAGEDSVSLMPLLKGGTAPVRDHAVSTSSSGIPALRLGTWKYIAGPPPSAGSGHPDAVGRVQLYNLAADLAESHDLAAHEPQRVKAMQDMLEQIISRGRSTPGNPQANDIDVPRHPLSLNSKRGSFLDEMK